MVWIGMGRIGPCVLLVAALGCGAAGPIPVKGIVTLDAKPLARATVQFIPEDPAGKQALATTDTSGAFQLSTTQPRDGALRGTYKVVIQVPSEAEPGVFAKTQEEAQQATQRPPKAPARILPAKYSQPDQTVLKHRVPEDGDVKLDLQSEKR